MSPLPFVIGAKVIRQPVWQCMVLLSVLCCSAVLLNDVITTVHRLFPQAGRLRQCDCTTVTVVLRNWGGAVSLLVLLPRQVQCLLQPNGACYNRTDEPVVLLLVAAWCCYRGKYSASCGLAVLARTALIRRTQQKCKR